MKLCHYFSLLLLWTVVKTEEDCGADNLEIAPYGCCQNNATYPAHGLDDLGTCLVYPNILKSKNVFRLLRQHGIWMLRR